MTLSVGHYLKIYQLKRAMMDNGTTHPNAVGRELILHMTTLLAELDPSLPCELSTVTDSDNNVLCMFMVNDEVIAQLAIEPDAH